MNTNSIRSYPTVYQIGHKAISNIFSGLVIVEEKCDGSQFSFGIIGGELVCRSKGKQQFIDAPDKLFEKAIEVIKNIAPLLHNGWIYRGEYLEKPKHNTLKYSRIPKNHIILFDIDTGLEEYLSPEEKQLEAKRIGLEFVPVLFVGIVENYEIFKSFLERESVLGGCKVEGVVVKNYNVFTAEKKVAMGKYVSEEFKEVHQGDWKDRNPGGKDFIELLISEYATEPRWQKAVQHLREDGKLSDSVQDIGLLIKEIPADVFKEEREEIKEKLFNHYCKLISRGITRGVPEWYKGELAKVAFENSNDDLTFENV